MTIAEIGIITILCIFLVIHVAVMLKFIPYSIVWGSRLKTDKEMYRFETVSVLMMLFFLWVAIEKADLIPGILHTYIQDFVFWIMTVLFAFNTVGNLVSKNRVERFVFTPLVLLLEIFCLIIVLK